MTGAREKGKGLQFLCWAACSCSAGVTVGSGTSQSKQSWFAELTPCRAPAAVGRAGPVIYQEHQGREPGPTSLGPVS